MMMNSRPMLSKQRSNQKKTSLHALKWKRKRESEELAIGFDNGTNEIIWATNMSVQ